MLDQSPSDVPHEDMPLVAGRKFPFADTYEYVLPPESLEADVADAADDALEAVPALVA